MWLRHIKANRKKWVMHITRLTPQENEDIYERATTFTNVILYVSFLTSINKGHDLYELVILFQQKQQHEQIFYMYINIILYSFNKPIHKYSINATVNIHMCSAFTETQKMLKNIQHQ